MSNSIEYIYQILDRYSGPLKQITRTTQRFKQQTNNAIKAAEKLGMRFERLPVNMRNFKRTIGSPVFQNQIKALKDNTGHIARNIDHMGKASNRFAISSKALRAGRGAPGAAPMVKKKASMTDMAGGFGAMAGMTLPVIGAGVAAVKTAIDFQSAFIGVKKTVDATAPQLAKMRKEFEKMSTEIPVSAVELMGIGEAAGQLGIRTENITSFTKTMAMLGATTNLSGEEGAKQLARFANITQMSQGDFDRLASVVVHLGNNLATSEAEIVSMGKSLAAAGKVVNMSESNIMAIAGTLSSLGIEAEAGSTAFSKLMLDINDAVSSGGKNLALLSKVAGMTAKDFSAAFKKDASGAMASFTEGLAKADKAGVNVNAILGALGMQEVRMRKAILSVASAGDLYRKSLGMAGDAWKENTALLYEAQLRFRGWSSQLIMARNKLMLLANSFGKIITPMWVKFVDIVVAALGVFDKLPKSVKTIIVVVAGIVTVALSAAAAIGLFTFAIQAALPILITVGGYLAGVFAPILATIGGLIASITWPVWLAIAAIVTLGIILKKAYDNSAMFRQSLSNLGEALQPITGGVVELIKMVGSLLPKAFGESAKAAGQTQSKFETFGDIVSVIVDGLAATIYAIVESMGRLARIAAAVSMGEWKDAWNILKTGKSKFDTPDPTKGAGAGVAGEKAAARSQDIKTEVSGRIDVRATGGVKIDRADIGLNMGHNWYGGLAVQ